MALSDNAREQLKQPKADVEEGLISEEDFKKQKDLVLSVNNQELQAASGLLDPLAGQLAPTCYRQGGGVRASIWPPSGDRCASPWLANAFCVGGSCFHHGRGHQEGDQGGQAKAGGQERPLRGRTRCCSAPAGQAVRRVSV